MPIDRPIATRVQPTWRVEVVEKATVASVLAKTITVIEVLVANRYDGQFILVVAGTGAGKHFKIQNNAAGTILCEETLTGLLDATSVLAISTTGQPPGTTPDTVGNITDLFGQLLSESLPMPAKEFFEGRYHGSDNMPAVEEFVHVRTSYGTEFPFVLKNAMVLGLCFPKITESTADYAVANPAEAITVAAYPGSYVLTVAEDGDDFTAGDIVHITGGAAGVDECAKVASCDATSVTLVHPLKNFHSIGAVINEVDLSGGVPATVITKVLEIINGSIPSFTLETGIRRTEKFTGQDIVIQFMGLMANKLSISSSPGNEPIRASIGVQGLGWRYKTAAGVDLATVSAKAEVGFDKGTYLPSACTIKVDDVQYAEAGEFSADMEWNLETPVFHNDGARPYYKAGDPTTHILGSVSCALNVTIPITNRNLLTLLADGAEFDASWEYERAGTGDTLKIEMLDCVLKGPLLEIPEEGAIPQTVDALATKMKITVNDFIPYYIQ